MQKCLGMLKYYLLTCVILSGAFAIRLRHRSAPDRSCPSLCKCGRRGQVTCAEENCLHNLPTANMSSREGARVRGLFVTKQKDLSIIRDGDLGELPNLRTVRIINNRNLGTIQQNAFMRNRHITKLDLHHNAFKSFPSSVRHLTKLTSLNLGGNQISYIPTNAFDNNPNLQRLILRRNKIEHFPRSLPTALVKLTIGHNLIYSLEDLTDLKQLRVLRMNSNRLTQIQAGLLPTSIRELSVCQNLLSSQSSLSVDNLTNLRKLRLAGNHRIARITRNTFFKSTNRVRELDLRHCAHVIDSDAFANFHRLRDVDLRGNGIVTFEGDWLKHSRKLKGVKLANNSWHCTCAMNSDLSRFSKEVTRLASTNHRLGQIDVNFDSIECHSLDFHLQLSNAEVVRKEENQKMSTYNFSTCPTNSQAWKFIDAPAPPGGQINDDKVTRAPTTRTSTSTSGASSVPTTSHNANTKATTPKSTVVSTTVKPTTTKATTVKPTRTTKATTVKPTTTTKATTVKPTTTTKATTVKPTTTTKVTTVKPTTTTKVTTVKPTTTTKATTVKPTTTTTKATTVKPTTTTTKATTVKPTTTTTKATTVKPTTTTKVTTVKLTTTTKTTTVKPTTTTTTTKATSVKPTTTLVTTTETAESESERMCTSYGDCVLPFVDDDGVKHNECAPASWGRTWCRTEATWGYCFPCT